MSAGRLRPVGPRGTIRPASCHSCGFTLVELLIALAMVSMIAVLLFAGLRVGSRTWDLVEVSADRVGAVRLANGFLRRTLSQARTTSLVFDGEQIAVFAGDAEGVEYAAPLSDHVGAPGLYVLRLQVGGDGSQRALILTRWLIHPEVLEGKLEGVPKWEPFKQDSLMALGDVPLDRDAAAGAFGRALLLEGVQEIAIDYYGVLAGETDPEWHKEWLGQPALPALIRIHLTTVDQTWPDLIVALTALGI